MFLGKYNEFRNVLKTIYLTIHETYNVNLNKIYMDPRNGIRLYRHPLGDDNK